MLVHAGVAAAVLVVAFLCFTRGWIGGGDAKLAAATVLWLGFGHLADYLIYASLLGGALTLLLIQYRALPMPQILLGREWAERLHRPRLRRALRHRVGGGGARGLSADRVDDGARPCKLRRPARAEATQD